MSQTPRIHKSRNTPRSRSNECPLRPPQVGWSACHPTTSDRQWSTGAGGATAAPSAASGRSMRDGEALVAQWKTDCWSAMLVVAHRYSGRATTAEDIAQEALYVAYTRRDRLRNPTTGTCSWLLGIVQNIGRQHARKRTRRERLFKAHSEALLHSSAGFKFEPCSGAQREKVLEAAESLPPKQREVALMMIVDGMSDDEIAVALGMSQEAVWKNRSRAVKAIAKSMGC